MYRGYLPLVLESGVEAGLFSMMSIERMNFRSFNQQEAQMSSVTVVSIPGSIRTDSATVIKSRMQRLYNNAENGLQMV